MAVRITKLVPAKIYALQRERRALKRVNRLNPHDDNIKHAKCVQIPSLYSLLFLSLSQGYFLIRPLQLLPSCSPICFNPDNTHSDLNDYSHEETMAQSRRTFL
ncbi:hypothetical protein CDAR_524321 [Caerostris darwini]|uniref:Uncharacterized protein n=1 Tax=Caerostris darwini TaxID=1538125 RepID=A0AAV4P4F1_9ARAC|nr:hypothetical protein CDAR_524321 [Caerostris darwini]